MTIKPETKTKGPTAAALTKRLQLLREPFTADEVEWRIGRCGKNAKGIWANVFCYVTNRAIQTRLDDVIGADKWANEFKEWGKNGVLCGLSIKSGNTWVTKWDGADNTEFEPTKGGLSDSMKRAAVQWGIGRYLYKLPAAWLPSDRIAEEKRADGWQYGKGDGFKFYWLPPELPEWALPKTPTSGPIPAITAEDVKAAAADATASTAMPATEQKQTVVTMSTQQVTSLKKGLKMLESKSGKAEAEGFIAAVCEMFSIQDFFHIPAEKYEYVRGILGKRVVDE